LDDWPLAARNIIVYDQSDMLGDNRAWWQYDLQREAVLLSQVGLGDIFPAPSSFILFFIEIPGGSEVDQPNTVFEFWA
jgi:hypothetical protein